MKKTEQNSRKTQIKARKGNIPARILLFLLLLVSCFCVYLYLVNQSQKTKIEAQKLRYEDAEKKAEEWERKAEDLEKELDELRKDESEQSDEKTEEIITDITSDTKPTEEKTEEETVKYADISNMETAKARQQVDTKSIDQGQLQQYFQSYAISDQVFDRIYGDDKSYKTYCTVPRNELVYIKVLHYDYKGKVRVGELIANEKIAEDLLWIFQKLFENKYQIEKMVLIDNYGADDDASVNDNNTSCFNYRNVTDSTELSNHAEGYAIDINPLQNPYFRVLEDGSYEWDNTDADKYWDRTNDPGKRHMINHEDLCYQLFTERGFSWGGDWDTPIDYQHFENNIEKEVTY